MTIETYPTTNHPVRREAKKIPAAKAKNSTA